MKENIFTGQRVHLWVDWDTTVVAVPSFTIDGSIDRFLDTEVPTGELKSALKAWKLWLKNNPKCIVFADLYTKDCSFNTRVSYFSRLGFRLIPGSPCMRLDR